MVAREHLAARPTHHRACYSKREDAPSEVVEGIVSNWMLCQNLLPVGLQGPPPVCLLMVIVSPSIPVIALLGTRPLYLQVFEFRWDYAEVLRWALEHFLVELQS